VNIDNNDLKSLMFRVVTIMVIAILAGCSSSSGQNKPRPTETPLVTEIVQVYVHPVLSWSYSDLADKSELVIIGRPVAVGETMIELEKPPEENIHSKLQVYQVEVELYLKGNGEDKIQVVQFQGYVKTDSGTPTVVEIIGTKNAEGYLPLSLNASYLMFLRPTILASEGDYYAGAVHPWRFVISDGCVYIEDIYAEDIANYFPAQPLENVFEELKESYQPATELRHGLPYPPPVEQNRCTTLQAPEPYPYP